MYFGFVLRSNDWTSSRMAFGVESGAYLSNLMSCGETGEYWNEFCPRTAGLSGDLFFLKSEKGMSDMSIRQVKVPADCGETTGHARTQL